MVEGGMVERIGCTIQFRKLEVFLVLAFSLAREKTQDL